MGLNSYSTQDAASNKSRINNFDEIAEIDFYSSRPDSRENDDGPSNGASADYSGGFQGLSAHESESLVRTDPPDSFASSSSAATMFNSAPSIASSVRSGSSRRRRPPGPASPEAIGMTRLRPPFSPNSMAPLSAATLFPADVTTAQRSMLSEEHDSVLAMQHDEARGTLTGGLGRGLRPEVTIRDDELLRQVDRLPPPQADFGPLVLSGLSGLHRSVTRALTGNRRPDDELARAAVIRGWGQDEADRRGAIVEVLADDNEEEVKEEATLEAGFHGFADPSYIGSWNDSGFGSGPKLDRPVRESWQSTVDISLIAGHVNPPDDDDMTNLRQSTFRSLSQPMAHRQVFYPRPNWRPVSMRAPYLAFLIALSLILAVGQEVLFRFFENRPLVQFQSPSSLSPAVYFAVKFAPTMMAVAYGVAWQITSSEISRLEAFYQLSRKGGALAAKSINVDYLTDLDVLRPWRALRLGHYAVALSSAAAFLSGSLVPTFASASLILFPDRNERIGHPDNLKSIYINSVWSRLLSGTLILCTAAAAGLLYLLSTRRSGLVSDVRGVAGLASMAVACHILPDFRDMDTASPDEIHRRLSKRRYMLRSSSLAPYDGPDNGRTGDYTASFDRESLKRADTSAGDNGGANARQANPHPLILQPLGVIPFLVGLVLFLAVIPTFLFSSAGIVTDEAPYVVTVLAVCVRMAWGSMDTAVRLLEPYYLLSRRHAPASTLTLDYTATPEGYLPIVAFLNGHRLVGVIGVGTVMAEVLTVLVTGLANVQGRGFVNVVVNNAAAADETTIQEGQETVGSFAVTLLLTLFILGYMIVVVAIVFAKRRHPFLPRQPSTIASVLAYIHQSRMLYDFVETASLSSPELRRHLEALGKTYGLGSFHGRDGLMHCGIDQEELTSSYRHGISFDQGNMPWNSQWEFEH